MNNENYNKRLIGLTWPIFIESFLRMLLGNVNVFMLSQYSDKAVGAVGIANQIISLILVMYGIVSMGTAIIVSQYIGAGKREFASKVANIALVVNLLFGMVLSISMLIFAKLILNAMNTPKDLMGYAYTYITIVGGISFFQALMAAISAVTRSFGYTRFPMYVALVVNLLNIIGNYICIFKPFGIPSFGVTGIAVTVALSEAIGVVISIAAYKKIGMVFRVKDLTPFPKEIVRDILKVGIPAAGESMSYTFSQMATTYIVTLFGASAITAKVYGQNFSYFASTLGTSIGLGAQILIGQKIGAGKANDAYKVCLNGVKIAIIANLITSFSFFIFRTKLISVFTKDTTIIQIAVVILTIDIFVELGRAFNCVIGNSLRGTGDVRFPVIISITSMWGISVVLSYLLGVVFNMGLSGVWIAFAVDECFRGILMLIRWRSRAWEKMSIIENKDRYTINQCT